MILLVHISSSSNCNRIQTVEVIIVLTLKRPTLRIVVATTTTAATIVPSPSTTVTILPQTPTIVIAVIATAISILI